MGEPIHYFDHDDDRMAQALAAARDTFKFLWRELSWESRRIIPGLEMSGVKRGFPIRGKRSGGVGVEHMWVGEVGFDGATIHGVLLNQPNDDAGVNQGDQVSFAVSEISDWLYAMEGKAYGGFSIQLMRSAMPVAERAQHDEAWGFDFGDASTVRLAAGLTYRDYCSMEAMQIPEHPMSLNMREKSAEGIRGLGNKVNDPLIDGMTMLHYESLAGNLTQAKLCIDHGARKQMKDGNGMTAMDYAQVLGWAKIVKLLG